MTASEAAQSLRTTGGVAAEATASRKPDVDIRQVSPRRPPTPGEPPTITTSGGSVTFARGPVAEVTRCWER